MEIGIEAKERRIIKVYIAAVVKTGSTKELWCQHEPPK